MTPYALAFPGVYHLGFLIFDNLVNLVFFFDIVVNFISVYYDEDYIVIDSPKVIQL